MENKKSKEFFQRSLKVAPGGVHSPVRAFASVGGDPLFFQSAQGAMIKTVDGEELIDFCQSFGPNILGHRDPEVQKEVEEALQTVWTMGACEPYSLELAEWICQRLPWVEKLRFVNSGTEAVMSALRVARGATGREKILKFEGCYHGHVDSMLVQAGSGLAGACASSSAGVSQSTANNTLVATLGDKKSVEEIFANHGSEIAAIIIEPLPGNFGLLEQDPDFLRFLREISQQHQSLLIFDEVISGFRVALGGMAEVLGIQPDLVTFGKIIGGGFPVGCYGGRADLLDQVAPVGGVYQAGTLSANPICMRAGLSTLKKIVEKDVYKVLEERGQSFSQNLQGLFDQNDLPWTVCHVGSLFWLAYGKHEKLSQMEKIDSRQGEFFKPLFHSLLKQGIYLPPSGYELGFLSYAHDEQVIERALRGFEEAIKEAFA